MGGRFGAHSDCQKSLVKCVWFVHLFENYLEVIAIHTITMTTIFLVHTQKYTVLLHKNLRG